MHVPRANNELDGVTAVHGPLDDANLEAIAAACGVSARDGGRCTSAIARVGVVGGVRGVERAAWVGTSDAGVADEDKVRAPGVFFGDEESGCHGGRFGCMPAPAINSMRLGSGGPVIMSA